MIETVKILGADYHYQTFGSGKELLLAFHGFGQNSESFAPTFLGISTRFTTVSLALPFHEAQTFTKGSFNAEDLSAIISFFLSKYQLEKCSLFGYSLGARLWLKSLEQDSAFIKNTFLAAPDGLYINNWYRFATSTSLGNNIFKKVVNNPNSLLRHTNRLEKMNIISTGIQRMAEFTLGDKARLAMLYDVWTLLADTVPDLKKVAAETDHLHILLGRDDHIIKADKIIPIVNRYGLGEINYIQTGHYFLAKQPSIADWILSKSILK